jgi:hypothetical protein
MAWKSTFGEYTGTCDTFALQRKRGNQPKRTAAQQRASALRLALPPISRAAAAGPTAAAAAAAAAGTSAIATAVTGAPAKRRRSARRLGPPGFGPEAKSYLERLMAKSSLEPGPGQFDAHPGLAAQLTGAGQAQRGKFGKHSGKSAVEWECRRAAAQPGPASYSPANGTVVERVRARRGGRFPEGAGKTDTEWKCHLAAQLPGPGQHSPADGMAERARRDRSRGRFSTACPKSDTEQRMAVAAAVPGPGAYGRGDVVEGASGAVKGRFPAGSGKSSVEWAIHRAAQQPGPGAYDPGGGMDMAAAARARGGGRFGTGASKSDIDWKCYHAAQLPAPGGDYEPPSDFGGTNNFAPLPPINFGGKGAARAGDGKKTWREEPRIKVRPLKARPKKPKKEGPADWT